MGWDYFFQRLGTGSQPLAVLVLHWIREDTKIWINFVVGGAYVHSLPWDDFIAANPRSIVFAKTQDSEV